MPGIGAQLIQNIGDLLSPVLPTCASPVYDCDPVK